jgi:TolB-like protein
MASIWAELKRRNVVRVGVAYTVVSWLLIEVASTTFPILRLPEWTVAFVTVLLIIGFPVALIFAWAYELTPEGVKRDKDVDRSQSITHRTGRKLDFVIIGALVVTLGYFLWDRQNLVQSGEDEVVDKSIAVLPFVNMSSDEEQEWFTDGLTEEIRNSLARTPDLRVASRTSSFKYKGETENVSRIAAALGVAHILEGSVRRGGDRLRVTAQLIRANDGFSLWSETFDRQPEDVIAIQENIAMEISNALQTAMDPDALSKMTAAGTASVAAYEAYLKGLAYFRRVDKTGNQELRNAALAEFERSVEIDGRFAEAHWWRSRYWISQYDSTLIGSGLSVLPREQIRANLEESIAAAIDSEDDTTLRARYQAGEAIYRLRFNDAISLGHEYLEAYPNDATALEEHVSDHHTAIMDAEGARQHLSAIAKFADDDPTAMWPLAGNLMLVGLVDDALDLGLKLAAHSPQDSSLAYQLHRTLLWNGQVDEGRRLLDVLRQSELPAANINFAELRQACAEGDQDTAEKYFAKGIALGRADPLDGFLLLQIMGRPDEAHQDIINAKFDLGELAGFLYYPFFDHTRFPNLSRVLESQGIKRPFIKSPPYACTSSG